jgi:glycosyltransferase involved in cell wall biosynthesis
MDDMTNGATKMKDKTKILQMPIRNAKGGITQYALRNWERIDKSRFVFDWVTLDKKLDFEDELTAQGCKVHYLSCRQEENEALFISEMKKILAHGYDAIHLHTSYWRGFLAEELALQAKIPKIIVHAHSTGIDIADPIEREKLLDAHNNWKEKFGTQLATHFVACSVLAANFLFGSQIPKKRIQILRNAIDTEIFKYNEQTRNEMRKKLGVENKFVLLQSGRLEYQKNFAFTLGVFEEYVKQNPDAVLLIAGDGSLRNELEKTAFPLGEKVKYLGFRNDISALLQAADVFLQPSLFEGFSIASVEAQCSGISWLVSENVPQAALPLAKAALPLVKAAWVDMLSQVAANPSRNIHAAEQLRELGWDLQSQIKILEELYASRF